MKYTLTLICIALFSLSLAAQPAGEVPRDVIVLKNGQVYRGVIEDYDPGHQLSLRLSDGSVREFPAHDIERIRQEEAASEPEGTPLETEKELDEIHLLDGKVYRGRIVEYERGEYLTLQLPDGSMLVFSELEIAQIGSGEGEGRVRSPSVHKPAVRRKPVYAFSERGPFHQTSFSFSFGERPISSRETVFDPFFGPQEAETRTAIGFNIQHVSGFQFNRWVGLGAGLSLDGYNLDDGETMLTFLGLYRAYLTKSIVAPFVSAHVGYGLPFRNANQGITEAEGGFMFHPEIGLRLGANDRTNFTLAAGYRFQDAYYVQEFDFNGDIQYRDMTYRRFVFTMGLLF